jgi:hypothetical protein
MEWDGPTEASQASKDHGSRVGSGTSSSVAASCTDLEQPLLCSPPDVGECPCVACSGILFLLRGAKSSS